ncbi:NERD domain-containing protein [Phycicoccus sp. KQZ13P-1]|uniref:NERD domain-containing protein n=1 Tax=Phycicoccus mangrovi TaxID=2840470 RepID=UPI001BFFF9A3|nr:NERD domain-containing protein [Phycicoccus mangrovi]MBT9254876.1 NERD domain-containing protein [Phycicoccus mangrovi]
MAVEGWSADQRAADLRARGKASAGAWAAGAEGERRVAAALSMLPPDWLVLHDRLLMPGLADSNIDHLVVGAAGVVLVDAKNWAGHLSEWQGSVFQHSFAADGPRRHRPRDREFAVVRSMAIEVARRVGVTVTAVIALAGARAAEFGEPRVVHGVWVVPVDRLASWLRRRPEMVIDDRARLDVQLRTEFPSTTTDPALLLAIGRELRDPHRVHPSGVRTAAHDSVKRRPAPRRTAAHTVSRRPARRAPRRSHERGRAFLGLVRCGLVWWAAANGALASVVSAVSSRLAATAPSAATTPVDRLACSDVDLKDLPLDGGPRLTPKARSMGCEWSMKTEGRDVMVMRMIEHTGATERSHPMFVRARKSGRAEVVDTVGEVGRTVGVWAVAGTRVGPGQKSAVTTRSMSVQVSYEAMGLSLKQGTSLARAVAARASAQHEPVPTTSR